MKTKPKILIITNGNFFANIILSNLFERYSDWICGVLIITGDYKGRTGLKSLIQLMKVTTFPYLFYKIISIIFFNIIGLFIKRPFVVRDKLKNLDIPIFESNSVKSNNVLDWVERLHPDLIVSVSCPQLIGKKILSSASLGGINIHSSLLPKYAGLAPYFWVLSFGEVITGMTIHYMSLKFDQGNILVQKELDVLPNESAFHLFLRLSKLGREQLTKAVEKAIINDPGLKQNSNDYSYFSSPTFEGYRNLKRNGHCLFRVKELFESVKENTMESLVSSCYSNQNEKIKNK